METDGGESQSSLFEEGLEEATLGQTQEEQEESKDD